MTSQRLEFGISMPMVGHRLEAGTFVRELIAEAQAAEEAGLEYCVVPEHHDAPPNALTDPLTVCGWLLAHTERLRVGPGVMLLPLYDPVHVAEQAGILQCASGGRLLLGLGAGYQAQDFDTFAADRATRYQALEDGITTLRAAWNGELIRGRRVGPVPATAPEILMGGSGPKALARATRLADGWISNPTHTLGELEAMAAGYREAAAAQGITPRTMVLRELWVDETDERARERYGPVIERVFRYYLKKGALTHFPGATLEDVTLDGLLRDIVICGSVETVTERVAELAERTNADACVFMLRHPDGPAHEAVLEAIRLLGTEVSPRVNALRDAKVTIDV